MKEYAKKITQKYPNQVDALPNHTHFVVVIATVVGVASVWKA